MSKNKKIIGKLGEDIACNFLQESGYQILNKNYKCHFGEIDIITRINKSIVFFEVKTRTTTDFGYPFESVNRGKIKKIFITIDYFLKENKFLEYEILKNKISYCFKVISIILDKELAQAYLYNDDIKDIDLKKLKIGMDYSMNIIDYQQDYQ